MSNREGLPRNWSVQPLEAVASVIQGQSPPGDTYNLERRGLPFFQGKAEFGPTHPIAVKWCTEPAKIAKPEDVLISIRAPVGPTNLANTECCIGRGLAAVRPLDQMPSLYFLYFLRHSVSALREGATGSTFEAISGKQLRSLLVNVPPVAEQHRIVEAIESYFSRLDDAWANLKRVQRNLKRYRTSVLKAAVEGRLVPTEAELALAEGRDYEPAPVLLQRILEERRRRWKETGGRGKYVEPAAPDTGDLPGLPGGWCWASMDQLVEGNRPICYGVLKAGPHDPSGVPLIRVTDIMAGDLALHKLKRCNPSREAAFARARLKSGDLVVTKDGSIGAVAFVPPHLEGANITQHVLRVSVSVHLSAGYIAVALRSPDSQAWMKGETRGVALQGINVGDFRRLPTPLPPLVEQQRICAEAERHTSIIDAVGRAERESSAHCSPLRQAVLKWAFKGNLVDQDPADEPAAKLLERIRAERQTAAPPAHGKPARGRPLKPRKT